MRCECEVPILQLFDLLGTMFIERCQLSHWCTWTLRNDSLQATHWTSHLPSSWTSTWSDERRQSQLKNPVAHHFFPYFRMGDSMQTFFTSSSGVAVAGFIPVGHSLPRQACLRRVGISSTSTVLSTRCLIAMTVKRYPMSPKLPWACLNRLWRLWSLCTQQKHSYTERIWNGWIVWPLPSASIELQAEAIHRCLAAGLKECPQRTTQWNRSAEPATQALI